MLAEAAKTHPDHGDGAKAAHPRRATARALSLIKQLRAAGFDSFEVTVGDVTVRVGKGEPTPADDFDRWHERHAD